MAKVVTVTLNPCLDKTLCVSELKSGEVNRAQKSMLDAGGKGINVSRALTNFGVDNVAMAIVGGDSGELLEKLLKDEGVEYDFLKCQGETRTNYKIFDEVSGDTTDINEPGITISQTVLEEFKQRFGKNLQGAEYAVLAGSIPPGVKSNIYAELIDEANKAGVKVILDTTGERLSEGIKAKPFAIKPNIHELEEVIGKKLKNSSELLEELREMTKSGIELVTVSMGADGAIFMKGNVAYKAGTLPVEVKSAVGCGDSVVAGIVYSLLSGFDLKKTAMISAAAGGITATKDGTNMCTADEVLKSYTNISIDRIEYL